MRPQRWQGSGKHNLSLVVIYLHHLLESVVNNCIPADSKVSMWCRQTGIKVVLCPGCFFPHCTKERFLFFVFFNSPQVVKKTEIILPLYKSCNLLFKNTLVLLT